MEASAVVLHASNPVTLSKIFCITASKDSNFCDSVSMESAIWASNRVGFRGARTEKSAEFGGKNLGKRLGRGSEYQLLWSRRELESKTGIS